MSDVVIRIEGLGKKYRIRHRRPERYTALRDVFAGAVRRALSPRANSQPPEGDEDFWALKDLSLEVRRGEILGIIGRNGAGKSTLLKILSRITEPTEGRIELKGRVASLLEVGTGFHPELTGRENIYLNGAILGMSRAEIRRKFDEIVAFAEVERFLDTPVKHYSSGMYVRLAFSVAAHLQPDILIVDEVLAVGDIAFQKKCLERMGRTRQEGWTVLFVTHNLEAAAKLCDTGVLLRQGEIAKKDSIERILDAYRNESTSVSDSLSSTSSDVPVEGTKIVRVWIENADGTDINKIEKMGSIKIRTLLNISPEHQNISALSIGIGIDTEDGARLVTCVSTWQEREFMASGNVISAQFEIPFLPFVTGVYRVSVALLFHSEIVDFAEHRSSFEVLDVKSEYHINRTVEQGHVELPFSFRVISS